MSRFSDWLHERAIKACSKRWVAAMEAKDSADARRELATMQALTDARSPEQIARMDRAKFNAMDPHAQRTFLDSKAQGTRK